MALLELNGVGVISAIITLPLMGVWHADLLVDDGDASKYEGDLTLSIAGGELELNGVARRQSAWLDAVSVRMVAGKGALPTIATAKAYSKSPARIVVNDLLGDAGESLSQETDATLLSAELPSWATAALPVAHGLAAVVEAAAPGSSWRMLPDGTFWAGVETWPDSKVDVDVIDQSPALGRLFLGAEAPTLLPGTTLGGLKIGSVQHIVTADAVRTYAWVQA